MIPKIIHQLWIGSKKPPIDLMNTWRDKHPDYTYIYWNEAEFEKRGFQTTLQNRIEEMNEICGKADILRWEILYKYGGIFIDADSICIEKIDPLLKLNVAFATFENERLRGENWAGQFGHRFDLTKCESYKEIFTSTYPLIANGTMAFPPNHELPRLAIEWIRKTSLKDKMAWLATGPGLLTRLYYSRKWDNVKILPSYYFLPVHSSGMQMYHAHEKIYAHQKWGSSNKDTYHEMTVELPVSLQPPKTAVSILMPSYNSKKDHLQDCLQSIKNQTGYFHIELVVINDGSTPEYTEILKTLLNEFIETSRFTSLVYSENESNQGLGYTLNKGVNLCSNEIIVRMDTDDIMVENRINLQFNFMKANRDIHICGGQIAMFRDSIQNVIKETDFKTLTFEDFKKSPSHWFACHPTLCFRKSSVLEVGNYNVNYREMMEDFDLELRMLKKYGKIHQAKQVLLYYRLHPGQVTHNGGSANEDWYARRNELIKNIIN